VVLVAHRLSTVKEADLIHLLHQGRVVEQGTHAQLMADRGRYAALWRAQTDERPGAPSLPALAALTPVANGNGKLMRNGVNHA
jgi:ATP-binding cassette subfamily B protein